MPVNYGEVHEIWYSSSFLQRSLQAYQRLGISEFDQNSEKKKNSRDQKLYLFIYFIFILFELEFFF